MAALLGGAALIAAMPHVKAQQMGNRVAEAFGYVTDGKTEQAYAAFKGITDDYGEVRGPKLFGPRYGELWYMRGYMAMRLGFQSQKLGGEKQAAMFYNDAVKALEAAHKVKNDKRGKNRYVNRSVLVLGQVHQSRGEYKEAIEKYQFFLKNRDPKEPKDKLDPSMMRVNLAICHFSLDKPDLVKGMKHFEAVLKTRAALKVRDAAIVRAFQSMSAAVIKQDKETLMVEFINEHRATLILDPYEMYDYIPLFVKLSSDALKAEMPRACVALLTLLPSTPLCDQDFEAVIGAYGQLPGVKLGGRVIFKKELAGDFENLKAAQAKPKIHEYTQFQIMAYFHEAHGNTRGAFGVFEQLELYHQGCPAREDNLYNLVRTANNIGEIYKTESYGQVFLRDFPKSDHRETVERLMLHSLFFNGDYEKCIQVARKVLSSGIKTPSKRHDVALHCLGGSYYYLGRAAEAAPFLEEHVEIYGHGSKLESEYVVASEYFFASNDTYMHRYDTAAKKLDRFLGLFPNPLDNSFLADAKYDRANCHYNLSEPNKSMKLLSSLIKEFPSALVLDRAWALKGNVEQSEAQREEAATSYKQALKIAQSRKNDGVEEEVLYYLVGLLGEELLGKDPNPRIQEAVPYYDQFWRDFPESQYRTQVAAVGVPALRSVGRGKEALGNLESMISLMANQEKAPGLEAAINSYSKEFLKEDGHTPQMLIQHYRNFPKVGVDQVRARALLSMGIIGVLSGLKQETDAAALKDKALEEESKNYAAMIDGQYQFLKSIDLSKLSNTILLSVGRSILNTDGADPVAASRYFQQVLTNVKDGRTRGEVQAYFGMAEVGARSGDSAQQTKALELLTKLYAKEKKDQEVREKALALMVRLSRAIGANANVIKYGREYLDNQRFRQKRVDVRFDLGFAYRDTGQREDAIAQLGSILGSSKGLIKYSAPACKAVMEMVWERNEVRNGKQDRQAAYEFGRSYFLSLQSTMEANAAKIPHSEKKAFKAVGDLYRQYEESGEVKKKVVR